MVTSVHGTWAGVRSNSTCLFYFAPVTSSADTTHFVAGNMTGYGNDFFVGWTTYVVWDAAGTTQAPQGEHPTVSDYVSSSGTFTLSVASTQLVATDIVLLIHPMIAGLGVIGDTGATGAVAATKTLTAYIKQLVTNTYRLGETTDGVNNYPNTVAAGTVLAKIISKVAAGATPTGYNCTTDSLEMLSDKIGDFSGDGGTVSDDSIKASLDIVQKQLLSLDFKTVGTGTFTTDSATVPRDSTRTEAINYFDSCWLVPTSGAEANQPRQISSYAADGTFTMVSGSTWLTAPGLVAYNILSNGTGKNVMAMGTLTLSSISVPEDNRRAEVNNYWNGCQIIPLSGAAGNQPRNIALFTVGTGAGGTGVFSLPSGALFTTAPGTVTYVIVRGTQDQVAVKDTTSALTYKSTIGNKTDSANTGVPVDTKSIIAYAKQIVNEVQVVDGIVDAILAATLATVAGALQVKATTIDLNQAAGAKTLFTGTAQVVHLEKFVIQMPNDVASNLTLTGITVQTNDVTPQVLITESQGLVGNMTAENQFSWDGICRIGVGKLIQLTIIGGAEGAAYVCNVSAQYRSEVAGGTLA